MPSDNKDNIILKVKTKIKKEKKVYIPNNLNTEHTKCVICSKEFIGRDKTISHYVAHSELKKKENKKEAEIAIHNGLLQCSTCLLEFLDKTELQNHEDHFHLEKKFMCPICNKCFAQSKHFIPHMKTHGTKDLIKCPDCDFTTTYSIVLKRHQKSHHKVDDHSICEICGERFTCTKDLSAHIRKNHKAIETRIYQCIICFKEYTSKPAVQHHLNQFHMGQKRAKRVCPFCGKSISENKFNDHVRSHQGLRPFACSYCGKSFTARRYLNEHTRIHTGKKPFVCQYCGKAFSQKSPLTIHLRSHTGETPYICPICNRGFTTKTSRDNHIKNDIHA